MHKRTKLTTSLLVAFGGVLLSSAPIAQAQDAQKLERVTVTGSNIKRTDTETASPVQVLTREDIEKTGKQSIQEILRTVTSDGSGSIPSSFSNGFASGSAAVSLRGLGVNSTLVLVNGRRMTTYGLADDGTRNFVDLNSLPLEAVDRIEVLKDGASAIYGADAVGGVVNVILRKSYTGASIGGSYGQSGKADGQTTRAFGSFGFGDLDADKYNVFVSLEASKQKNIWSKDRGFIGQSDLRSLGYYDTTNGAPRPYFTLGPTSNSPFGVTRNADGTGARVNILPCSASLIDPTTGLCRYNPLDEQEVQPQIERLNLFTRGTLQLSESMTGYVELGLFNTKSKANGTLGANNDGGVFVPGDPFNPLLVHGPMVLPAAHPDNTFGVDRMLFHRPSELGGRDQTTDNKVYRLIAGLQGAAAGWDYDVGVSYIKSELKNTNTGFIRYGVMQAALDNGTYRFTPGATDPSVIAAISPALTNKPTSSIKVIDVKVSRELMSLAGGPLGLALGAETRWEEADTPPVPFTDTAEIVGLGYSAFSAKRRVSAVFGELNAPVTKWLELNGAVRYDRYSDFGSSTTPKVGFKVKPIDQVAIRGTYAEAFRAPGPAESGGSSFGFTTYGILSQGNPSIKPEEAKSYTLGLIVEPMPGTSATLDFWKVDRENEIVQADPNSIIGNLPTAGTPLSRIPGAQPNTFIYYDANGDIGTVTGFYRNAAQTKTEGVDLELRQRLNLGEAGRLSAQLNWTHVRSYERTDPDGNTFEYAGTHGPLVQSAGGGSPKDRLALTLSWDRGPWAISGAVNYVGPIKMVDNKGEVSTQRIDPATGLPDPTRIHNNNTGVDYPDNGGPRGCGVFDTAGNIYNGCRLPSFTTFDLFARWSPTKNLDLNFSIQNLFDRKAPFDPYLAIPYGINYNQTWHQAGAIGRFFTVGAKYSFY
ncbi:TonB-dependent receptor [uncultured Methylibium sp.]|uniref:TonB-dependent receptor n=1 Tax=uncultured Methylibium sp. TaxID=381093 RepID=UPI0025E464F2|nr:TonB-dependent receptor [uncultured Methylibium sp.]